MRFAVKRNKVAVLLQRSRNTVGRGRDCTNLSYIDRDGVTGNHENFMSEPVGNMKSSQYNQFSEQDVKSLRPSLKKKLITQSKLSATFRRYIIIIIIIRLISTIIQCASSKNKLPVPHKLECLWVSLPACPLKFEEQDNSRDLMQVAGMLLADVRKLDENLPEFKNKTGILRQP